SRELPPVSAERVSSSLGLHGLAHPDSPSPAPRGAGEVSPWPWLFASYLLGAIPTSYLAGKLLRGIDLREHGSGNLGATNSFRVLGPRVAAWVMILDMAKGFAPVALFPRWDGNDSWAWALAY